MRIGILMTGHVPDELTSEIGTYPTIFAHLLDGHGFTFRTWAVVDEEYPDSVEEADGWLITGSKHAAYEDHPWIPPLEEFIRTIHSDGRPLVGICFGHQIVAQALGGKVELFDGGWSVGRTTYDFEGEDVVLNAWHRDQVVRRPEGAKVVGTSDFCENAALLYGNNIYTIQPHPEFDARIVSGLIRTRGSLLPPALIEAVSADLTGPTGSADFANRIAAFFLSNQKA